MIKTHRRSKLREWVTRTRSLGASSFLSEFGILVEGFDSQPHKDDGVVCERFGCGCFYNVDPLKRL